MYASTMIASKNVKQEWPIVRRNRQIVRDLSNFLKSLQKKETKNSRDREDSNNMIKLSD